MLNKKSSIKAIGKEISSINSKQMNKNLIPLFLSSKLFISNNLHKQSVLVVAKQAPNFLFNVYTSPHEET